MFPVFRVCPLCEDTAGSFPLIKATLNVPELGPGPVGTVIRPVWHLSESYCAGIWGTIGPAWHLCQFYIVFTCKILSAVGAVIVSFAHESFFIIRNISALLASSVCFWTHTLFTGKCWSIVIGNIWRNINKIIIWSVICNLALTFTSMQKYILAESNLLLSNTLDQSCGVIAMNRRVLHCQQRRTLIYSN